MGQPEREAAESHHGPPRPGHARIGRDHRAARVAGRGGVRDDVVGQIAPPIAYFDNGTSGPR
ncbi:hypothetical protein [Amycolatopsis sp. lyj-109]|uniref:hypothetical protein n=1 Tax=Amycolatopsis sp. lyj-109 TaxID=2789287 RepID=UPI003978359C